MADSSVRRRQQGRPPGGRQRTEPGRQGAVHPLRLPRHRHPHRMAGRGNDHHHPSTEERAKAAIDVFKEKLIRRDISMKAFDAGDPQASGKTYKVSGTIKQGIDSENAKKITKLIRDEGPKGVKAQIQGDEIRVSSKKRDDLQAIIAMLKKADIEVALQFVNYREFSNWSVTFTFVVVSSRRLSMLRHSPRYVNVAVFVRDLVLPMTAIDCVGVDDGAERVLACWRYVERAHSAFA